MSAMTGAVARGSAINGPAGRIHVDDGGSGGLPVVFAHSFAGSGAHWFASLAHLRPTRRAIAIDLRGHGESDPPAAGSYGVVDLAADIAAVVDSIGLDRFVLVGHSMGGAAAIAYSGANPDRVAGLVLVGTPGRTPPEQADKIVASMEADYETVSEDYWKRLLTGARPEVETRVRSDMARVPNEASLAIIKALFDYDPVPALRAYRGPKLLIDTPQGDAPGSLHELFPEIRREVIPGTSHWPQLDKPEAFNEVLDAFLTQTSPEPNASRRTS
jgi:pimeloyl-ACP methyl ester carboxylesterase